jgi:hypothetical protein
LGKEVQENAWGDMRIVKRPRRGSNSQPLDSKSITLSIELRGLAEKLYPNIGLVPFWDACYNLAPHQKDNPLFVKEDFR